MVLQSVVAEKKEKKKKEEEVEEEKEKEEKMKEAEVERQRRSPAVDWALKACSDQHVLADPSRQGRPIVVHRDRNAAKNILHLGLRKYRDGLPRPAAFKHQMGIMASPSSRCGKAVDESITTRKGMRVRPSLLILRPLKFLVTFVQSDELISA